MDTEGRRGVCVYILNMYILLYTAADGSRHRYIPMYTDIRQYPPIYMCVVCTAIYIYRYIPVYICIYIFCRQRRCMVVHTTHTPLSSHIPIYRYITLRGVYSVCTPLHRR
jgi:hypothetical protein